MILPLVKAVLSVGGGYVIGSIFKNVFGHAEQKGETMYNCHSALTSFHNNRVSLSESMKSGMRKRRNTNQERLKKGLVKNESPLPLKHVKQGSYAMHTMVQAEYSTSDIDDGAIFAKEDLVGPRGGTFTPKQAKEMVRDALDDGSFKQAPIVHSNCVRVYYNDGFTIDIPVYREIKEESWFSEEISYELASFEWKETDPEGVTKWFNAQVIAKSPDETNGRQMRRIVKLLKAWCKSRKSWNMPSGFILSKLTDENYIKDSSLLDRDDKALLQIMEAINTRLQISLVVDHPVVSGNITKTTSDTDMVELRDRLPTAISTLSVLRDTDCTELDALKALKSLFNTDYFDERIQKLKDQKNESSLLSAPVAATGNLSFPDKPVTPRKPGGFAG